MGPCTKLRCVSLLQSSCNASCWWGQMECKAAPYGTGSLSLHTSLGTHDAQNTHRPQHTHAHLALTLLVRLPGVRSHHGHWWVATTGWARPVLIWLTLAVSCLLHASAWVCVLVTWRSPNKARENGSSLRVVQANRRGKSSLWKRSTRGEKTYGLFG